MSARNPGMHHDDQVQHFIWVRGCWREVVTMPRGTCAAGCCTDASSTPRAAIPFATSVNSFQPTERQNRFHHTRAKGRLCAISLDVASLSTPPYEVPLPEFAVGIQLTACVSHHLPAAHPLGSDA